MVKSAYVAKKRAQLKMEQDRERKKQIPDSPIIPEGKFVYVIGPSSGGVFKIGRSNDPADRMKSIQSCCPDDLKMFITVDQDCENSLHRALKWARIRPSGEWFRCRMGDIVRALDWLGVRYKKHLSYYDLVMPNGRDLARQSRPIFSGKDDIRPITKKIYVEGDWSYKPGGGFPFNNYHERRAEELELEGRYLSKKTGDLATMRGAYRINVYPKRVFYPGFVRTNHLASGSVVVSKISRDAREDSIEAVRRGLGDKYICGDD